MAQREKKQKKKTKKQKRQEKIILQFTNSQRIHSSRGEVHLQYNWNQHTHKWKNYCRKMQRMQTET